MIDRGPSPSAHSSKTRFSAEPLAPSGSEMGSHNDRQPFNSPDLARDLGLQTLRRPREGEQQSVPRFPPPIAPPDGPPPTVVTAGRVARTEPTPKDNC